MEYFQIIFSISIEFNQTESSSSFQKIFLVLKKYHLHDDDVNVFSNASPSSKSYYFKRIRRFENETGKTF